MRTNVIKHHMNTHAAPSPLSADAAELVRRLGMILAGLAALVAARFLRNPRLIGLIGPLWRRLTHVASRIERAMARPLRAQAKRVRRDTCSPTRPAQLPQGRGWLVRELGYEAVGFGLQLQHLLTEPAMQAALATMPAAGLILRPVCRMLGMEQPMARSAVAAAEEPTQSVAQPGVDKGEILSDAPSYNLTIAADLMDAPTLTAQTPQLRAHTGADPP